MGVNDFQEVMAIDGDALVATQADYIAWAQRTKGFASGIVFGKYLNKVLRQTSYWTYLLTLFIVDETNYDLFDNADAATHLTALRYALDLRARNAATGRLVGFTTYSQPGSGIHTMTSATTSADIIVIGGGGGGSNSASSTRGTAFSSGGGGGAGGHGRGKFSVSQNAQFAFTIGAGGASQGNGGLSSFGTLITAYGGQGSQFQATTSSAGGLGGISIGGNCFNATGNAGSDGQSGDYTGMGDGGSGPFGGAGRAAVGNGYSASGPGSGGGGAYSGTFSGGLGSPGLILVREYAG